jgi:chorismate-pyruvate lyase
MPVKSNLTVAADIQVHAREIDFVTRFAKNWDALREILGIMRPVEKTPGTKLISYEATMKSESLQGGASVGEGEEINFREVIMHKDDQPLIYAISHVPLQRCSKEVCADLLRADIPIGRILKNYKIESRREVNNIFIEKPNDTLKELFKTEEDFLARDYVIINNDEILMWIKEMFPVSYFSEI